MNILLCLSVTDATARLAAATLAGAGECARIFVVDDTGGSLDRAACQAAAGKQPLAFLPAGECAAALRAAAQEEQASGVLFVTAGTLLPEAIGLRLARVAARDPALASVSPFCNESPAHHLLDAPAPPLGPAELARLDRLAFLLGSRGAFEVPAPLPDCHFVPAAALGQAGGLHALSDSACVARPGAADSFAAADAEPVPPVLAGSRRAVGEAWRAGVAFGAAPGLDPRPVHLHVTHNLGGGSEKWLNDYCGADTQRVNLVLRAVGEGNASGGGLALYAQVADEAPLRAWRFARPIDAAATAHLEYRAAVAEICRDCCVDAVVVSSLIGHSLDILDTGLPTVFLSHDYFPYCPAINLHFDGLCTQCDGARVAECFAGNPKFNPFITFLPPQRLAVRERFLELMRRPNLTLAAPSRSVEDNLKRLDARFGDVAFAIVPHGYGRPLRRVDQAVPGANERLRILVLGQISVLKGLDLFLAALPRLREFAEIFLVGCRELGELFRLEPNVHVVSRYDIDELPGHVAAINPHVGLLTSICPETFGYALTELMALGVPPVATSVGAFAERIRHGENGFLYAPDAAALVAALAALDGDRAALDAVRGNLAGWQPRTAAAMVADYHRLVPLDPRPWARAPATAPRGAAAAAREARDQALLTQSLALADMWKSVKSLHLQLGAMGEARGREKDHLHAVERLWQGAEAARQQVEYLRQLAEQQFAQERLAHQDQLRHASAQAKALAAMSVQIESLTAQIRARDEQLEKVFASTSWKFSLPLRLLGRALRKARALAGYIGILLREPAALPRNLVRLQATWRASGALAVKQQLRDMQAAAAHQEAWTIYHRNFARSLRPAILQRIAQLPARPLISVLVPTYNTPEAMLRQMLRSVQQQLYPEWQLCIADDGSSQPHVKRVLEEFAAKDARIRLHCSPENRGVSHASNRALDLASGDFVVLLDHDDLLEEQALFRVAEAIIEDAADMVYSDEVMVSVDTSTVQQYAFRPAYSPELLRGHPYFVHLLGFRRQLLRDIGGFDESLSISQDYDLMLRASEQAERIVHIPEILYQWRIHGSSAGQQRMREVMETSRAILQRHLDRCGEHGTVEDGAGFNLFDARYALRDGLRVAIVIPTKNHGDLVRQCIDSLRATAGAVPCDIIVVDHESDDPQTLAYFAAIAADVRILRYHGPFNFSAINNWAVAQLDGGYSHYLLCNNDIEAVHPGWLERMLELGQHEDVGAVGALLLYPDGSTIQHAGVCVGTFGAAEHFGKFVRKSEVRHYLGFSEFVVSNREVSAVTAACLLIRREAFEAVAGFDEALAVGFGDVDLCLRVGQKGYRILQCAHAELIHHESFTRGKSVGADPHPADSALFRARWQAFLEKGDPYSNPNLSLNSVAWQMQYPIPCGLAIRRRVMTRQPHSAPLSACA